MTPKEAEAVDAARRRLLRVLPEKGDELRVNWYAIAAEIDGAFGDANLPTGFDEAKLKGLVEKARKGDKYADARLRAAAARAIRNKDFRSHILREYAANALLAGITKPKANRLHARNLPIATTVLTVCEEFDLLPTRDNAARHKQGAAESGCSIVAKALGQMNRSLGEDAVETIWKGLAAWRG